MEECYASPVGSSDSTDVAATAGLDGRKRRTKGSSTDDDPIIEDMINENFRAGGPRLAPLPCHSRRLPNTHPAQSRFENDSDFQASVQRF